MNNYLILCLLEGIALAFAIIFGGIVGFLWVLVFSAIGIVVGLHLDGKIDLSAIVSGAVRNGRG